MKEYLWTISFKAYSASVYSKILSGNLRDSQVCLLMAKSKVIPIKFISIPRLGLCGATLLTTTLKFVIEAMSLKNMPIYCHSDSVKILAWLSKHPSICPIIFANRVSLIYELLSHTKLQYILTKVNPVDGAI